MIYLDSSVLLAGVLAEPRSPAETLWEEDLASSQLLAYEVWNRRVATAELNRWLDQVQERR